MAASDPRPGASRRAPRRVAAVLAALSLTGGALVLGAPSASASEADDYDVHFGSSESSPVSVNLSPRTLWTRSYDYLVLPEGHDDYTLSYSIDWPKPDSTGLNPGLVTYRDQAGRSTGYIEALSMCKEASASGLQKVPVTVSGFPDGSSKTIYSYFSVDASTCSDPSERPGYVQTDEAVPGGHSVNYRLASKYQPATGRTGTGIPEGTVFTATGLPDFLELDPATGTITGTTSEQTPTGRYEFDVEAAYPSGTREQVGSLRLDVYHRAHSPAYETQEVTTGSSASADQTGDRTMPDGTVFSLAPGWSAPQGWSVAVDGSTGRVTATADASVEAGTSVDVELKVSYPDGSWRTGLISRFTAVRD